jgi:hypothetical protein
MREGTKARKHECVNVQIEKKLHKILEKSNKMRSFALLNKEGREGLLMAIISETCVCVCVCVCVFKII